jgi:DNA repair exonuclease SbcCD ATPase subunit
MTQSTLTELRKVVNKHLREFDEVESSLRREEKNLKQSKKKLKDTKTAHKIVQVTIQSIQEKVHHQIAGTVTKCLQAVFEDDYSFHIDFEQKRGRTEATISLQKGSNKIPNPLRSDSGGVIDVAAFALRLTSLLMHQPPLRKTLILDEPFKFVSAEYRENVRQLLEQLTEEFQIQIIMVTHIPELVTGRRISI